MPRKRRFKTNSEAANFRKHVWDHLTLIGQLCSAQAILNRVTVHPAVSQQFRKQAEHMAAELRGLTVELKQNRDDSRFKKGN